ncbi:NAD-dependent epimerase/dehydratase family protein [Halovivax cerinus]|uniref:NAD-dependent epimerase/dehydratase family protein n=1 Tax=Halovivax cerinus TaxID=1487865 RepID=A0ABD5NNJ7_9EURY|nr:NAD(P)-dependent oxidoreductase [Halovivax cerinus]
MHIFVAGATGVLGRRLVAELEDRGHNVVGLVRDDAGAEAVRSRGGTPVVGDVLDRPSLVEAVGPDIDAIVHAATAIPTDAKPSAADWKRNDRIRIDGTEHLLAAAREAEVGQFVAQSIVWVARQPDGSAFDETATPNPDRTTASALEAEELVEAATAGTGMDGCVLRGGWFYAPDAAHTRQFGERLLAGRMPVVGSGLLGRRDATLSVVHVDDAAAAYASAIEHRLSGVYHVVDEEPVTLAAFLRTLADELGASAPRRVPGWLARLAVGRDTVRLLTNSMPTNAARFRAETGWKPVYSTYEAGIERVVERWRETGAIERVDGRYVWRGEV